MATTVRWEKARQALAQAEATTGVRTRIPEMSHSGGASHGSDASRISASQPPAPSADHVPVPAALLELFPDGGLARGSVTNIGGAMSVLFALAATAMGQEGWCALVGVPDAGLAAAAGLGLALRRVVVVPDPGAETPQVLAALVDGVDVVVLGHSAGIAGRDQRRLTSRLRRRGAVLLTTGSWEQPDMEITALSCSWHGVGQGDGLLRRGEVELQARHRRRPLPFSCRVQVDRAGLTTAPEPAAADTLQSADAPGLRPAHPSRNPGQELQTSAPVEQWQKEPA